MYKSLIANMESKLDNLKDCIINTIKDEKEKEM